MNNKTIYKPKFLIPVLMGIIFSFSSQILVAQSPVTISEVDQVIPTYLSGPPDPNPMFFFGKASQGAEGRIYPYPLYDNLTNKKSEKSYHLVYLENEYVKIGILPEIGGRIFSALDKTNNYNFVYDQHVIKPALIGLIGSWISGGIEWNIPHHHRASTFMPVQWSKEENADGSKTVWVGELEVRQRMRWAVGYTLRPGSSVLECSIRIINRTPMENTMLCFANVAVHTNENYQVIFPPSTEWATGHSKREFYSWPVVMDKDMSWYKNNTSSASWFAVNHKEDFVAGYDHGVNAGTMTIANHHIVPGKKFFTWGVGNMWDKILTDDDGPYLEIMVGAYSDNQPDYSWLQPFEERSFVINWYPFRGIDGVKNSNLDAAVNLEVKDGKAGFGFYTTKAYKSATVSLKAGDKVISQEEISIDPGKPYFKQVSLPAGIDEHSLRATITGDGHELVAYSPVQIKPTEKPAGVKLPVKPEDIKNNEELFLAGQRIDQFHNPTLDADLYWEEVLRRDPGDVKANTGMGILNLRKAQFETAEKYFNKAINRLAAQYTDAKDCEPWYYLGVALKAQGKNDEAFTAFYKAAWSQEWKSPAYFSLAEIASLKGNYEQALDLVNQSIDANALNARAYGLKAALLRHLNKPEETEKLLAFAKEKTDPLDARIMAEKWLATKNNNDVGTLFHTLNENPATAQEIAAEYDNAGLWNDGQKVLTETIANSPDKAALSPLVYYYLGYFAEKLGEKGKAKEYRRQANLQSPEYVFPFQSEVITVLKSAIAADPKDGRALYYLGNLLYDWQPEESVVLWKQSAAVDPDFAITWRNLAIAHSHQKNAGSQKEAIAELEKAISIPNPYPTHFAELDRLYQAAGTPVQKRLAVLEKNERVIARNDEALGSMISLKIFSGKPAEAISLLKSRTFSIWEGGSIFNTGQAWADACLVRGQDLYHAKKYKEAIADFQSALNPPESLRAEQRHDLHNTQVIYWLGCAYDAAGEKEKAKGEWNKIISTDLLAKGSGGSAYRRSSVLGKEEEHYYQALAKQKLGVKDTQATFNELVTLGTSAGNQTEHAITDNQQADERKSPHERETTLHYIAGLGYTGLGDKTKAREEFNSALKLSPDFLSAKIALTHIDW
jgi:tetratricopeptide (TPR) repeat protein